ncbi:thiol:disulfide interchange protein [Segniliparus rugosus]|uniref:Soluble secreted antigen MPT53 n=1 Tax=Segniliparus rugosus (strain ATCC BAA-974 / DSM 45345 / CCUG 50838 / CIP 108380 / JCM 13579 / CDC 945) TaxID=679197 RepID=E5XSQ9_SEGRC|nr:hypothetical protein HMPREF9336_02531 [Segniliparus rugosus ATCC BAA-974]
MSINRFVALVPVLAAFASAGCSHADPAGGSNPAAASAAGHAAPAQLRFSAKTLDGADFSGETLAGKPAVLWFWAPWCPTCQREAAMVAKVAAAHPGVAFVGVGARDSLPALQDFVSKHSLTFTQLNDADSKVWAQFGITRQPAYAFVGPNGSVEVVKDSLSEEELNRRIAAIDRR